MTVSQAFSQQKASDSLVTDEILVTANRFRTSLMLSPNSVQVLEHDFIASINGDRLSDVLGCADGIFIKDYGFNSGLKTISLNGTQSEHTLILLDGVKLNNRQNSQVDLGIFQTDEIERIEISKGGSSALYGSEAIGGVVSIMSSKSASFIDNRNFGIELRTGTGSYGLQKYYAKYFQRIGFLSYILSGSYEESRNNYDYFLHQSLQTIQKQRQGAEYKNHSMKITGNLEIQKRSFVEMFGYYSYWNRNLPGAELGYVALSSKQIDRDAITSLSYKRIISRSAELRTNIQYRHLFMNYYNVPASRDGINSFHKLNSFAHSSEYRLTFPGTGFNAGYEISYANIFSSDVEYAKSIQASVYSDLKFEFGRLSIYPSLRYDRYSEVNKNIITGKLGVNIKPLKKVNLALKSSVGNNFRLPSFNDLFWKELGNKNLLPEKSISFDAGMFYEFKLLARNTLEFSYYNINTSDRIVWEPDNSGIWRPSNVGNVKSEGIDIGIRSGGELTRRLTGALSLNYNYGTALRKNQDSPGDDKYSKQLLYLPQETFKSSLMLNYLTPIKWLKSISLNTFYTFTGKRYMNLENTVFAPYFELVDANICFNLNLLKTVISLKAAVNNLTNTDYQVITGYPMPLRNYKFEVGFKY